MATYTFVVPGEPVAKQRPRHRLVTPKGRKPFVVTYTPKKTTDYEKKVGQCARDAGIQLAKGPYFVSATFYIHRPDRFKAKRWPDGPILCDTSRQDTDNIFHCVMDGLNGVVFNDNTVARIFAEKYFHGRDEAPRAVVTITELEMNNGEVAAV